MESAILGGYADHVRELHPEAPWPGIYLADDLFDDARRYRANVGDEKFFAARSARGPAARSGARSAGAWTAARFEAAVAAPPGDDARGRLVGDLVKHLFPAYHGVSAGKTESFLSLDKGLSVISRHARDLGYDAPDPVPRRADPLARLARRRPRLRPPGGAEAGQAGRVARRPTGRSRSSASSPASATSATWSARTPPAPTSSTSPTPCGTGRAGSTRSSWRTATSPSSPRSGSCRPKDEACRPGAEAGLRAGDQGPPRGHADPADPRRRPRDVPHGLPLQPGAGADAGGRLQRAPARADGAEDHAPAPGREARHAQGRRPDPLRRPLGHGGRTARRRSPT